MKHTFDQIHNHHCLQCQQQCRTFLNQYWNLHSNGQQLEWFFHPELCLHKMDDTKHQTPPQKILRYWMVFGVVLLGVVKFCQVLLGGFACCLVVPGGVRWCLAVSVCIRWCMVISVCVRWCMVVSCLVFLVCICWC